MVRARVMRTGDGTHRYSLEALKKDGKLPETTPQNNNEGERDLDHFWGWVSDLNLHHSFINNHILG